MKEHLADTYFAWAGDYGPDGVFYYRVYSPVILIEFEHQAGIALDNDFRRGTISTRSCARRTATTPASTCCASTTSATATSAVPISHGKEGGKRHATHDR